MKRMLWLTLVLAVTLGGATAAVAVEKNGGLAACYISPTGDFENAVGDGFGLSTVFDYPMTSTLDVTGSLGWYRFSGITLIDGTNLKTDATTMWEFVAGPQLDLNKLYIGIEGGYFTNLKEWGLVPNIGLRKGMVDLAFRYKTTADGKFYAARLGFFF